MPLSPVRTLNSWAARVRAFEGRGGTSAALAARHNIPAMLAWRSLDNDPLNHVSRWGGETYRGPETRDETVPSLRDHHPFPGRGETERARLPLGFHLRGFEDVASHVPQQNFAAMTAGGEKVALRGNGQRRNGSTLPRDQPRRGIGVAIFPNAKFIIVGTGKQQFAVGRKIHRQNGAGVSVQRPGSMIRRFGAPEINLKIFPSRGQRRSIRTEGN